MPPQHGSPTHHGSEGNSAKLSYVFAFGAAVFIVSGNYGVAVCFGLMAAAAVLVTVRKLPPGRHRETGGAPHDGRSGSSGRDA